MLPVCPNLLSNWLDIQPTHSDLRSSQNTIFFSESSLSTVNYFVSVVRSNWINMVYAIKGSKEDIFSYIRPQGLLGASWPHCDAGSSRHKIWLKYWDQCLFFQSMLSGKCLHIQIIFHFSDVDFQLHSTHQLFNL